MSHITYLEAAVVGFVQGVTELFPVSSLGHNVLIPALVGGSWATDLNVGTPESPYLAFIVGLHVATAIALLIYFWRDWVRIVGAFFRSLARFARPEPGTSRWRLRSADQRLAWMIVLATIPVGLVGLRWEHEFRVITGHAITAAYFLIANGVILLAGERFSRRRGAGRASPRPEMPLEFAAAGRGGGRGSGAVSLATGVPSAQAAAGQPPGGRHASGHQAVRRQEIAEAVAADQRLGGLRYLDAAAIGATQILALLAGISRDGVVMVGGMFRGLSRGDAARFSFLLATPVILAAGVLKLGDLFGPLGSGIRGQVLLGSVLSGVGAYLSVRFLMKYFTTRTLTPFAIYCLVVGAGSIVYLNLR